MAEKPAVIEEREVKESKDQRKEVGKETESIRNDDEQIVVKKTAIHHQEQGPGEGTG